MMDNDKRIKRTTIILTDKNSDLWDSFPKGSRSHVVNFLFDQLRTRLQKADPDSRAKLLGHILSGAEDILPR